MTALLSVIVPTKNRQHTAVVTVAEAARIGTPAELEIVVHDCSDEPELRDRLAEAGLLDRVVYRYVGRPVSMTENWNLAMAHATGEWVTIIGDDDAIVPGILEVARWGSREGLDAVKAAQISHYNHPDHPQRVLAARLRVSQYTGRTSIVQADRLLVSAASTGDRYFQLPMIYHNLVRRSVMERIHGLCGHYFDGLAPDVYSAFAIGGLVGRFGEVDYPLTLFGASAKSNSGRQNVGLTHLHAEEYGRFAYTWMTPDSWILPASVPDNVVRALTDIRRTDLLRHVDVPRIFARTIRAEPGRAAEHLRKFAGVMRRQKRSVLRGLAVVAAGVAAKFALDGARSLNPERPDAAAGTWFSDVPTLGAAIDLVTGWLAEHHVSPPR
jgi:glycosyltransferase involved in cell wall biosynthesis